MNALAGRTYRHAREWAANGGEVEVVTVVPHFLEGKVCEGYGSEYREEVRDGIRNQRVPMYVASNAGALRRSEAFASYMLSALVHGARRVRVRDLDVVATSSPQMLTAVVGWCLSRLRDAPQRRPVRPAAVE